MSSSSNPLISVVIPALNAERTIGRAVESLLATGYSGLEIVVVDDGSHDETFRKASELVSPSTNVEVRVIRHPLGANRGVSASRNLGIRQSSGSLLCFLDADDTVEKHRFNHSVRILQEHPDLDAVYETASVVVEDGSQSADWVDQATFGISAPLKGAELLRSLIRGIPWPTSAILFRRSLLDKTGNFHEGISIAEDCHLWMRMVVAGKVVAGDLSRPVSQYRRHAGSLYTPAMERKLDYLIALASFLRWINTEQIAAQWRTLVRTEVTNWLDNAFIQCRKNKRCGLALSLGVCAATQIPTLAFRRRNIAHLLYAVLGK